MGEQIPAAAEVRDLVLGDAHLAVLDRPGDDADLHLRQARRLRGDMLFLQRRGLSSQMDR